MQKKLWIEFCKILEGVHDGQVVVWCGGAYARHFAFSALMLLVGWQDGHLRGPVVERRSLAGVLSLSCAWPAADG